MMDSLTETKVDVGAPATERMDYDRVTESSDDVMVKLAELAIRKQAVDAGFVIAYLCSLMVVAAFTWQSMDAANGALTSSGYLFFAVTLANNPLRRGLKCIANVIQTRWAPSYFIQERKDLILLWGSVEPGELQEARRKLLAVRPGYKLVGRWAFALYGCTLAAVPAGVNPPHSLPDLKAGD